MNGLRVSRRFVAPRPRSRTTTDRPTDATDGRTEGRDCAGGSESGLHFIHVGLRGMAACERTRARVSIV